MGLFGFGKKREEKQEKKQSCNCQGDLNSTDETQARIKILGSGCQKCNQLEEATRQALVELDMDTSIEHVRDFEKIAAYGVMATPALVIDKKVLSTGRVLKKEEVLEILKKEIV